jgi:hypothetical protein
MTEITKYIEIKQQQKLDKEKKLKRLKKTDTVL